MSDAAGIKPEGRRKPYTQPQLTRVELRPQEAVLGACKTAAGVGPAAMGCNTALGGPCNISGS